MRLRQRLAGLGALVVLIGILVGLPALLVALGGNPLPQTLPSLDQARDALLTPDDGTLALTGAKLLGWVVWAALSVSIAVEAVSALRGVRPPALPVLSLPQSGMRPLVIAAFALFIAAPSGVGGSPAPAAASAGAPFTAAAAPVAGQAPMALTSTPSTATATLTTERERANTYVVRPGDTLWSIAQQHLGFGHEYHRIVDLNSEKLTGGAERVTPGMVLQLPVADNGAAIAEQRDQGQVVVVQTGDTLSGLAAQHLGEATRWPEIYEASTATVQPDGRRLADPDLIYPGWRLELPDTAATQEPARTAPTTAAAPAAADAATTLGTQMGAPEDGAGEPQQRPAEANPAGRAAAQTGVSMGAAAGAAPVVGSEGLAAPQTGGDVGGDVAGDVGGDVAGDVGGDVAGDVGGDVAGDVEEDTPPEWLLEGIVGSGALLGGALFTALTLRRRSRFRARRPGRAVAPPDPVLTPVEKTIQTRGPAAAVTLEHLDETLRRLGAACVATGAPVPAVSAVQLAGDGVWLHLSEPADLGAPWQDAGRGEHWFLSAVAPLEQVGQLPEDSPAPFPLLVSIGTADDGSAWLLNLEGLTVALTGAAEYVDDLARYLAAEVAVNPWSAGVRLDCVGIAQEVVPMNPARVRIADSRAVEDLVAEVVGVIERVGEGDVPTARVGQDGEDTWPARVVLLGIDAATSSATDQLRGLLAEHAGRTGACAVLRAGAPCASAVQIEATADGRLRIPAAGLDLVGVGLTVDEAAGCAALLAQSHEESDVPMPVAVSLDPGEKDRSWRGWSDQAGAIRPEHTTSRARAGDQTVTLLPEGDDTYEEVAATTAEDLSRLAPRVERDVAREILGADPTLDADLAAWWDTGARVPKLTLLGPVAASTWGKPLAVRKPYLTELLAYLALHPHGVTTAQTAEAFGITEAKTRDYMGRCREWLGQDPTTGDLHLPNAQDAPAARARRVKLYQVLGLLVDVDLFRRLRTRAGVRGGTEGIEDLRAALRLVQGRPFDQLRRGGWGWLFEGDRLDQHMTCAVVDVAHTVVTHDLQTGDLAGARAVAEIAFLAAPHEEIPTLDLAAVTALEGNTTEAVRLLQRDVCNRADDPDLPPADLPGRTQQILDRHRWLEARKEAV
ncbi:LysM peptidoglycan-binding domain-containing protein [Ornithinimicrobium sediminis]|uniref:LysM peptidoglycan-binding domain-containing protein n=1 Tax=Ornithinimicrobium sediminis TaxID=2904603 RepID=UPI001E614674|nr:LysM peptidoglycan-binding domain-containing protein [Ornithinimicrobium sediminis]MCE0485484.1 LysM peptidoglycan-binding domain-containing protein [Ornithinimicrobium sediminis]